MAEQPLKVKDIMDYANEGHPDPIIAWRDGARAAIAAKYGSDLESMMRGYAREAELRKQAAQQAASTKPAPSSPGTVTRSR